MRQACVFGVVRAGLLWMRLGASVGGVSRGVEGGGVYDSSIFGLLFLSGTMKWRTSGLAMKCGTYEWAGQPEH